MTALTTRPLAVVAVGLLALGCSTDSDGQQNIATTSTTEPNATTEAPDLEDLELSEQIDTLAEGACVALDRELADFGQITSEMEERFLAMSLPTEAEARRLFAEGIANHCPWHADDLGDLNQR